MTKVNILLVGGGGGGGTNISNINEGGGGGGGGSVYTNPNLAIGIGIHNITIGQGGIGGVSGIGSSIVGLVSNSGGGSTITTTGGTSASGFLGGTAGYRTTGTNDYGSGGGGGDAGVGANGLGNSSYSATGTGQGGSGTIVDGIYYGGGGGGGSRSWYNSNYILHPPGGLGGGGYGGGTTGTSVGYATQGGQNGLANTGGGGGGSAGGANNPGSGGSGIVKISFKTDGSDGLSTTSTGGVITTSGGIQTHTFTSNGVFNAIANQPPVISNILDIYFTNNELSNYNISGYVSSDLLITGYGLTGTLPAGISFDNVTGIISGTSNATGTHQLVFSATNQSGTTTKNFNLIINSPTAPVMGVVADIVINSWQNINVSMFQYVTQTNQDPILSYNLVGNNLPGLEFNTTTGLLSGSPTKVGVYNLGVNCIDKDGQSNTSNFTLTITKGSELYGEPGFFDLIANSFN